jgi:hypothetical protein
MTFKKDTLTPRLKAIQSGRFKEHVIGEVAKLGVRYAKEMVPKKTGNLNRSIRVGRVTANSAQMLAGGQGQVGYAAHVEFGTKGGQMLRPVHKKALAWGGNRRLSGSLRSGAGAEFFSMGHKRGATKAKPYLVPGAKKALQESGMATAVVKAWNDAA